MATHRLQTSNAPPRGVGAIVTNLGVLLGLALLLVVLGLATLGAAAGPLLRLVHARSATATTAARGIGPASVTPATATAVSTLAATSRSPFPTSVPNRVVASATSTAVPQGTASCASLQDYALAGVTEMQSPIGGWLHVEFYRFPGDPEREALLRGGRFRPSQQLPGGHVWLYPATCSEQEVRSQVQAQIQRRVTGGYNNAGIADDGLVASVLHPVAACPANAEARRVIGVEVQQLAGEECGWFWRGGSVAVTCPRGWLCTLHNGAQTILLLGAGQRRTITAGTFRFADGYAPGDAALDPCALLKQEQDYVGGQETVMPEEFRCPAPQSTATPALLIATPAVPVAQVQATATITPAASPTSAPIPAVSIPAPSATPTQPVSAPVALPRELARNETVAARRYAVISGDIIVNGVPQWPSNNTMTGLVVILDQDAMVTAPNGGSMIEMPDGASAAAMADTKAREVRASGCADGKGCASVIVKYYP